MTTAHNQLEQRLMGLHAGLMELFHRHQLALLDRDADQARLWLERFADAVQRHIDDENGLILPIYGARGGEDSDSPPAQFETEHRKILELVDRYLTRVSTLPSPLSAEDLLSMLDAETYFKSLMEHHDVREGKILYPKLSEWMSPEEQAEIIAKLSLPEIPQY